MKTEPIKRKTDLEKIKNYLLREGRTRDYAIVVISVNTALRCSDVLALRWGDVYDFEAKRFKSHIVIVEKKTKKVNKIKMNKAIINCLKLLKEFVGTIKEDFVLFKSQKGENKAISRIQMYRIIKSVCKKLNIEGNFGCHSLRKTFGYNAFKTGVSPYIIVELFNHSSFSVTRRYLGIDQDEKDKVFMKLIL